MENEASVALPEISTPDGAYLLKDDGSDVENVLFLRRKRCSYEIKSEEEGSTTTSVLSPDTLSPLCLLSILSSCIRCVFVNVIVFLLTGNNPKQVPHRQLWDASIIALLDIFKYFFM